MSEGDLVIVTSQNVLAQRWGASQSWCPPPGEKLLVKKLWRNPENPDIAYCIFLDTQGQDWFTELYWFAAHTRPA